MLFMLLFKNEPLEMHIVLDADIGSTPWLIEQIVDKSAKGIAGAVGSLIRSGTLQPGTFLPTVRDLGLALGVSPATVSQAWSLLRKCRSVTGTGRQGTWVIGPPTSERPVRFERTGNFSEHLRVDLSSLSPDVSLLPDLAAALAAGLDSETLHHYTRIPVTPRLADAVTAQWPFPPSALLAVNGGYEGLLLLLQTTVMPGDQVAVEQPTAPRILDLLDVVDAKVIPLALDEFGVIPDSLRTALESSPVAVIWQPRAQSPTGCVMNAARCAELAGILDGTNVLVIEDDGIGLLSRHECHSVGVHLPMQTVLVRSFSKSHGPDLRIGVIGGATEPIRRVRSFRNFGAGWTSRILQDALAFLLEDAESVATVDRARHVYNDRRESLAAALLDSQVRCLNRDGISLWVPVTDEQYALVTLAAHGISVSPGREFSATQRSGWVRVSTTKAVDSIEGIADIIALAALPNGFSALQI